MSLGYEVTEDKRSFESKAVSRHTSAIFEYPCLVIKNTVEAPIRKYMIDVHRKMQSRPTNFDESSLGLLIHLYIIQDSKLLKLDTLHPNQVKSFLQLFDGVKMTGWYDEDTELTGDMLYALAE